MNFEVLNLNFILHWARCQNGKITLSSLGSISVSHHDMWSGQCLAVGHIATDKLQTGTLVQARGRGRRARWPARNPPFPKIP